MVKMEQDLAMSGNQVLEHPLHAGFNFTDHFLHEVGDLGVGSSTIPSLQFCKQRQKSCSWGVGEAPEKHSE